jgi:hypothetical protein
MFKVVAPNDPDEKHLAIVIAEMRELGKPTIRVVEFSLNYFGAIEGSHRHAAAGKLGIIPEFILMTESFMTTQGFGNSDTESHLDQCVTPQQFIDNVEETCGWIGESYRYEFAHLPKPAKVTQ